MSNIDHMSEEARIALKNYGKEELIVCPQCKGKGLEWHDVGHHTSDYESELCKICGGDKMVVKLTWNPEFLVRTNHEILENNRFFEDDELHKLIAREAKRLLEK